jgi:hypothetical protein
MNLKIHISLADGSAEQYECDQLAFIKLDGGFSIQGEQRVWIWDEADRVIIEPVKPKTNPSE